MNKIFTTLLGLGLAAMVQAQEVSEFDYSYAEAGAETAVTGVGRTVTYDIAILLDNPALKGYELVGVSADIPTRDGCECAPEGRAWLSTELLVHNDQAVIDVCEKAGTIVNLGSEAEPRYEMTVRFDTPYVITDEPLYAGYSITVTKLKNYTSYYPVQTAASDDAAGGLYVHCVKRPDSSDYKWLTWTDLAAGRVSTMRVILRGPHGEFSVAASLRKDKIYGVTGTDYELPVTLTNYGSAPVEEVTYTVADASATLTEKTLKLDSPIPAQFGSSAVVTLPVAMPALEGEYPLTLTLGKVNGNVNLNTAKATDLTAVVRDYYPVNNPLVEEYTGLWCGQCPEAFVLLEETKDVHPELLYIAFHENDALMTISPGDLPAAGGAPRLNINRSSAGFTGFEEQWLDARDTPAPADINVKISWTDDTQTALRADVDLKFVEDHADAKYAVTYCLVGDDMSDPDWKQRNFFFDATDKTGKYWDLFVGKGMEVKGLSFSNVVLAFPNSKGIEDSLPSNIEAGKTYSHATSFTLADVKNVYTAGANYGQNLIKDSGKLRIVAVLTDLTSGRALNCVSSGYSADAKVYDPNTSGIGEISAENQQAELLSTEYYSLSGVRMSDKPENGAVITVRRYSDGSVKTAKELQ